MIYKRENINDDVIMSVAQKMCTAAITAPKGHGIDNINVLILDGDDKKSCRMPCGKSQQKQVRNFIPEMQKTWKHVPASSLSASTPLLSALRTAACVVSKIAPPPSRREPTAHSILSIWA